MKVKVNKTPEYTRGDRSGRGFEERGEISKKMEWGIKMAIVVYMYESANVKSAILCN